MNAALTLSTLTFNLTFSDSVVGSERREVSRGVNLPEVLKIRHQKYIDSKTQLPGVRSNVLIERHVAITDGRIVPVTASLTVAVPSDALIASTDVLAVVERIAQLIQEDDSGLDLPDEIFVNREQ
jgi:hypothetical protein